jgi:hypothetical protein
MAYQLFDELNCYNYTCMANDYKNNQNQMCNYRMEPLTTHMRCFRDPVLEHTLRTDTINSRIYTDVDCKMLNARSKASSATLTTTISQPKTGVFSQMTKQRGYMEQK